MDTNTRRVGGDNDDTGMSLEAKLNRAVVELECLLRSDRYRCKSYRVIIPAAAIGMKNKAPKCTKQFGEMASSETVCHISCVIDKPIALIGDRKAAIRIAATSWCIFRPPDVKKNTEIMESWIKVGKAPDIMCDKNSIIVDGMTVYGIAIQISEVGLMLFQPDLIYFVETVKQKDRLDLPVLAI